jgi:hypothetical protein
MMDIGTSNTISQQVVGQLFLRKAVFPDFLAPETILVEED